MNRFLWYWWFSFHIIQEFTSVSQYHEIISIGNRIPVKVIWQISCYYFVHSEKYLILASQLKETGLTYPLLLNSCYIQLSSGINDDKTVKWRENTNQSLTTITKYLLIQKRSLVILLFSRKYLQINQLENMESTNNRGSRWISTWKDEQSDRNEPDTIEHNSSHTVPFLPPRTNSSRIDWIGNNDDVWAAQATVRFLPFR